MSTVPGDTAPAAEARDDNDGPQSPLLDLRFTIGLFFAILGVILLVSVALPGGSRLSLYAGGVYLAFAAFMLGLFAKDRRVR